MSESNQSSGGFSPMKMFRPLFIAATRRGESNSTIGGLAEHNTQTFDKAGHVRRDVGISINSVLVGDTKIDKENTSKAIIQQDYRALELERWNYPGWGGVTEKIINEEELEVMPKERHYLDSYRSTAISGNDLMASVLYTTGLVCVASGQLAPISMLICVCSLYPFVKIFQECGTAIPLNGGVYVALLNSSSKLVATFAASCSLIDLAATAVVSAASCTSYAQGGFGEFPVQPVTIAILAAFACIVVCGVKESANVATAIFALHLITLIVLIITAFIFVIQDNGQTLSNNWSSPLPINKSGGIGMDLYLGFSTSLLGLTGFETSANYIEDIGPFETESNRKGPKRQISIFEKTMSNMWLLVFIINPTIAILTLGVVDLPTITSNTSNILSLVGSKAGGKWLRLLVNIDAVIVLAGGVLTANVGIVGLIKQLASDRCLPYFLLKENKIFGTNHWISLSFFLLCVTLYLITNGDVTILSGVFSISFLMVLILFAWANLSLKYSRPRLPRGAYASWSMTIIGFLTMIVGLIGNIIFNTQYLLYFLIYVGFFFLVILINYERLWLLKMLWYVVHNNDWLRSSSDYLEDTLISMKNFTVLFYTNTSELHILNKAILYARENECCDRLIVTYIHPTKSKSDVPEGTRMASKKESFGYEALVTPHDSYSLLINAYDEGSRHDRVSTEQTIETLNSTYLETIHESSQLVEKSSTKEEPDSSIIKNLKENLQVLDHMYPKMKIDLLIVEAEGFTPRVVKKLSEDLKIPLSFMFIRCPGKKFKTNLGEFGGVRTIMK